MTKHRRPVVSGRDTEAMTLVRAGKRLQSSRILHAHGGTNPEGKRTTLQESRETGYPNDLPVKNYDFNAPIREHMDSCRTAIGEYGDYHCFFMILEVIWLRCPIFRSREEPGKPENFSALRTAVRYNAKTGTGFLFVNNYVRHYPMSEHLKTRAAGFWKRRKRGVC